VLCHWVRTFFLTNTIVFDDFPLYPPFVSTWTRLLKSGDYKHRYLWGGAQTSACVDSVSSRTPLRSNSWLSRAGPDLVTLSKLGRHIVSGKSTAERTVAGDHLEVYLIMLSIGYSRCNMFLPEAPQILKPSFGQYRCQGKNRNGRNRVVIQLRRRDSLYTRGSGVRRASL
jgi:hypothetical protein